MIIADLIEQGIVSGIAGGHSRKYQYQSDAPQLETAVFENQRKFKREELDKIMEYAETNKCRMFYLCEYLEDKDVRVCDKCDNCLGKKWTYEINVDWQQKVDDFENNYCPEIELVPRTQQERPLSERKSKLVNGVAFSNYGFSNVGSTIHRCKYENGGDFPDVLLNGVLRAYHSHFNGEQFDLIVYVPPTQSGDLVKNFAEKVSAALRIPISHGLVKRRDTKPQKVFQNSLLKNDNVKDAFDYENPAEVKGKNVLLIDDICDSRATIKEIGKLMGRLGVNKIAPLVIAKTIAGDIMDDKPDLPEIETDTADIRDVDGIGRMPQESSEYNAPVRDEDQIFQALREWWLRKAEENSLPPYCIFPDKTLHNIARARPSSLLDLLDITGFGKTTIKKYGDDIIKIINEQER
ncbi:MAG: HRDC domain-containing protein [Methanomicrobia archaeon]|nr:HRDC domain-containing protein [Methanomicrobia archaeon]